MRRAPSPSSFDLTWSPDLQLLYGTQLWLDEVFERCSGSSLTPAEISIGAPAAIKMHARGIRIRSLDSACRFTTLGRVLAAKIWKYLPSCDLQVTSRFEHREILGRCFINFTLRRHGFDDCMYNSWSFFGAHCTHRGCRVSYVWAKSSDLAFLKLVGLQFIWLLVARCVLVL